MTLVNTDALVLQSTPFQESSSIVRVFTREQGKISVIAKGARRMKSSLRGFLEPLNHIDIIYYYKSTRDIQTLTKVELIKSFFSNSIDIDSSIYGLALLETIDRVIHDHQHDHEIFESAIRHLEKMDGAPRSSQILYTRFLLSLTHILGYQINLNHCPQCKKPLSGAVYDSDRARLICHDCGRHFSTGHQIKDTEIAFLKNPQHASQFTQISPTRVMRLLIHYLRYHLDIALNLKSLQLLSDLKTQETDVQ